MPGPSVRVQSRLPDTGQRNDIEPHSAQMLRFAARTRLRDCGLEQLSSSNNVAQPCMYSQFRNTCSITSAVTLELSVSWELGGAEVQTVSGLPLFVCGVLMNPPPTQAEPSGWPADHVPQTRRKVSARMD